MKIDRRGVDLFFSSTCNMRCEYCYINHSNEFIKNNKRIRKDILDGTYLKRCLKIFNKDKVNTLSLWGAEPTMNNDVSDVFMEQFLSEFKYIESVMFSTNFLNGTDSVLNIVRSVNKHATKLDKGYIDNMTVQISLDGQKEINDVNRHKGATDTILNGLQKLVDGCRNFKNIKRVKITFKPTLNTDSLKYLTEDRNNLLGWYRFFEGIKDSVNITSKNVSLLSLAYPTLVNVGYFTKEDGLLINRYLEMVYSIDAEKELKYYRQPLFISWFRNIESAIYRFDRSITKTHENTCGGGDYSIGISNDNRLCMCHRIFSLKYDNDIKANDLYDKLSANINNEYDVNKLQYIIKGYHDHSAFRIASVKATMLHCARTGLIDRKYIHDNDLLEISAVLLTCMQCYMDSTFNHTDSVHISCLSYVLLLCNGAIETLIKNWIKYNSI